MNGIFLSVIVCTRNREDQLVNCLRALAQQARELNDTEIIVVDNGSTDNTRAVVEHLCRSTFPYLYAHEPEHGLCRARNRGRMAARGAILAYIDDDAIPHPNWMKNIRQHFLSRMSHCLAGRTELKLEDGPLPSWYPESLFWVLGKSNFGEHARPLTSLECPQGQNFAVRGEVFDAVGGFNPRFSLYCDEVEFFRRVNAYRFTTHYRPDIAVDHHVPAGRLSKSALRRKAYLMGQGAAMMNVLSSSDTWHRYNWTIRYLSRIVRVCCSWCIHPSFDRYFTFWLYMGCLYQLLSGSERLSS